MQNEKKNNGSNEYIISRRYDPADQKFLIYIYIYIYIYIIQTILLFYNIRFSHLSKKYVNLITSYNNGFYVNLTVSLDILNSCWEKVATFYQSSLLYSRNHITKLS